MYALLSFGVIRTISMRWPGFTWQMPTGFIHDFTFTSILASGPMVTGRQNWAGLLTSAAKTIGFSLPVRSSTGKVPLAAL